MNTQVDREISATARWGIGILIALAMQSGGMIYWFSAWSARTDASIDKNAQDIAELKKGAAVILTREQLDDVLLSRDTRLDNIEKSVGRIEVKLDRLNQ